MRSRIYPMPLGLCALLLSAASLAGGVYDLELVQLRPDIYQLRRPDTLRQPVEPNATVIVNEKDVVVVDAGGAPLAAQNAIRLIRSVTNKPVSVLINTHWHGDHNFGNQVYRASFPNLTIVAHERTRAAMLGEPMSYLTRPSYRQPIIETIEEFKQQQARGELSERRRQMLEDLQLLLQQYDQVKITPPDVTVQDGLVLYRGAREIQVRHLGRANTDGDLVVWLPQDKLLISGDIVVEPIPYGFGSYPREWIQALDSVAALPFDLLVPGHGEVQHDRVYVTRLRDMLINIRAQVAASVAKGLDLKATREALDTSAFAQPFVLDDPLRKNLFDAWWLGPIVRSAWLEARGLPIKQGASDETG